MSNMPYVGLRPFNRDETDIFFGRETYTDELLELLGQHKFIAVVGDSGCGKSSLVRTGLEPSLQAGLLSQAGTQWRIAEMHPASAPFANLVEALLEPEALGNHYKKYFTDDKSAASYLLECVTQGSLSLHQLLQTHPLPHQHKLLIVCDQFEEIFRYDNHTEAAAFVSLLLASSQSHPFSNGLLSDSIYVVMTMRSDYLGKCALFSGLTQAVNQGIYLTPRLTRLQLREAIEEPVFVHDGSIEPALIERLLNDAENNPDQLPLLQHLLMRMWELANDNHSTDLTLDLYENVRIGGLKQALSIHADEIYNALNAKQQKIAKVLFSNLIMIEHRRSAEGSDIRQSVKLTIVAKLAQVSWQEVVPIVEAFRQPMRNFLTPVLPIVLTAESMIDISHESLIRHWQRFQQWLMKETKSAVNYRRLRERALLHQEKKAVYLVEPELSIYWNWYKETEPTALWAERHLGDFEVTQQFLLKSRWKRFWRRFRVVSMVVTIFIFVAGYESQLQHATESIEEERDKTRQSLDMLYKVRDVFFTKENSPELEIIFSEVVTSDPNNIEAWIYLADALKKQNKFDAAEKAYDKALKINPRSGWALRSLISMLMEIGKFDDAIKIQKKQIELEPHNVDLRVRLIETFIQLKKVNDIIKTSQESIKLFPRIYLFWNTLGRTLFQEKEFNQAAIIFNKALSKFPKNVTLLINDAELAIVQNDKQRFQSRVKTIQSSFSYSVHGNPIISFFTFIADSKKHWKIIIETIELLPIKTDFTRNFIKLEPVIQRQDKKRQQQIRLFIDYFSGKIDLVTLKRELKASEQ